MTGNTKESKRVTQELLKELMEHNKDTGNFIRKIQRGRGVVGSVCGQHHPNGYIYIHINKINYRAHHLVWLYYYGKFPSGNKPYIDHINGVKHDNRLENLREATPSQNQMNRNMSISNTSGFKGVYWKKERKKWHVYPRHSGKRIHVGYYDDLEDAVEAYHKFCKEHHGEFYKDTRRNIDDQR